MVEDTISSVMALFFSLIVLWVTSLSMIRDRCISDYLPFLFFGVLLIFHFTMVVYGVFLPVVWLVLELLFLMDLVWIFLIFRRGRR